MLTRRAALLSVLALAFALRFIGLGDLPLFQDEAYYFVWSQHINPGHLELSFYDHPAGLAYILKGSIVLFGSSPFGVRALFASIGVLNVWLIYLLARYLFDETTGIVAAFLLAINFGHILFSRLATSDTPAMLIYTALILVFARAVFDDSRGNMILTGLLLGLGFNIKYTVITLAPGFILFLLIYENRRRWLLNRYTLYAAILAVALTAPVFVWNAQHQWAGIVYQYRHASPMEASPAGLTAGPFAAIVSDLLFYPTGWLLFFGISFTILLFVSVIDGLRVRGQKTTLLLCSFASMFLFFSFSAGKMFHWALPVVVPMSVLAARFLLRLHSAVSVSRSFFKIYALTAACILAWTSFYAFNSSLALTNISKEAPEPKSVYSSFLASVFESSIVFAEDLNKTMGTLRPDLLLTPNWVSYSPAAYYLPQYENIMYTYERDYQIGVVWGRDVASAPNATSAVIAFYTGLVQMAPTQLVTRLIYSPENNAHTAFKRTGLNHFTLVSSGRITTDISFFGVHNRTTSHSHFIVYGRRTNTDYVTFEAGPIKIWALKDDASTEDGRPADQILHFGEPPVGQLAKNYRHVGQA